MKTYLLIIVALTAITISCKSGKEKDKEKPVMHGEWIFPTPVGTVQHWILKQDGSFDITAEGSTFVQRGHWNIEMQGTDSIFNLHIKDPKDIPVVWTVLQHTDSILRLRQSINGRDSDIEMHR